MNFSIFRGNLSLRGRVLVSFFLVVLSFIFAFGAVAAWFVFSMRSNYLFVYSGNIDLKCEVYVAIDKYDLGGFLSSDGVPDIIQFPPSTPLSRLETLQTYYQTMYEAKISNTTSAESDGTDSFKGIYVGRQLLYKIVIINESKTKSDALINVSFFDMTAYFEQAIRLLLLQGEESDFDEVFSSFSPRLLFNIRSRAVNLYQRGDDGGYNIPSELGQPVVFAESYVPLWAYSRGESAGEYFFEDVRLPYGSLIELDFALSCDFLTEEFNNYISAAQSLYFERLSRGEFSDFSDAEINEAITQIATKEALYITKDDNTGAIKNLNFEIASIVIKGEQRPNEEL